MIAVVVPAHNEEAHIAACLTSLRHASRWPALHGEEVMVVVVLDACSDRTSQVVAKHDVHTVTTHARTVGTARAMGARYALEAGARWLAFTDADSTVAPDWFAAQLAQASDVVCGTVSVETWGGYGADTQERYHQRYRDRDGHDHVHGANLGVSAQAYRRVGGFGPLASGEDVALVHALQRDGASIAWSAAPRVVTSARRSARAPGGFGDFLKSLERSAHGSETAA